MYPWLWAVYVQKTGDTGFLASRFAKLGPLRAASQPSIETAAQEIAAARTGPGGIIGETNYIDANGYWTSDNYEALLGWPGTSTWPRPSATRPRPSWAAAQYASLLKAVNSTLAATITAKDLSYIPCSMIEPNTANRCTNPEDANGPPPASTSTGRGTPPSPAPR